MIFFGPGAASHIIGWAFNRITSRGLALAVILGSGMERAKALLSRVCFSIRTCRINLDMLRTQNAEEQLLPAVLTRRQALWWDNNHPRKRATGPNI